jgi:hypothetical protein
MAPVVAGVPPRTPPERCYALGRRARVLGARPRGPNQCTPGLDTSSPLQLLWEHDLRSSLVGTGIPGARRRAANPPQRPTNEWDACR